jgi:pantoate--beta-alanine ligase
MLVIETVTELRDELKKAARPIGFVPTMGALHQGHMSLVNSAKSNATIVASIFVNPAQFTDPEDLKRYPRTIEKDLSLLKIEGCDIVFFPPASEIYPKEEQFNMDFGQMEKVMEGAFRPGHFKGVAKVVKRLFEIVNPDTAYFGEKDFQQLSIIKELNRRMGDHINIVGCKTIREADGLALSSRNIHLNVQERERAGIIYKALEFTAASYNNMPLESIKSQVKEMIENTEVFKLQYIEIVDEETLQPVINNNVKRPLRACIAVLASRIRLIDNIAV